MAAVLVLTANMSLRQALDERGRCYLPLSCFFSLGIISLIQGLGQLIAVAHV